MPILQSIKFSKPDKFGNLVFIATDEYDNVNYMKLISYYHKLVLKAYDTFLPLYHNEEHEFASIRFHKGKFNPVLGCKYDIDYTIKVRNKDDKQFCNCYINSMKFVSKAAVFDEGEELDLD